MSTKESCIIVSTPFQIISAYSIVEMFSDNIFDLYIIGNFKNYKEIAKKLRETNTFRNIITYSLSDIRIAHDSKISFARSICRQFSYLRFKSIGRSISVSNAAYEDVFFAAAVSANELLLYFQFMYHPSFHMFDDGVMTYRNVDRVLGTAECIQITKYLICRLIGIIKPDIYVYLPDLFNKMNGEKYQIKQLMPMSEGSKQKLCNVFGISTNDVVIENEVIIESKVEEHLSLESQEKLESIYKEIIKQCGKDNLIFKRHPRDSRQEMSDRKYMRSTVPFELYGCIQDWADKYIYAWDSTAVLTPKMFYNQEPTVILLYKIVKGKINNFEETDRLYQLFSECYKEKGKFFIPETKDDLESFIRTMPNKLSRSK